MLDLFNLKKRSLDDFLEYKKYILFGAGDASDEVYYFLTSNNKKIISYIDSNSDLIGKKRNDISINSPDKILEIYNNDVAIVISSSSQLQIAEKLINEFNINISNIFPFVTDMFSKHFDPDLILVNEDKIKKLLDLLSDEESKEYMRNLLSFRLTMDSRYLKPNPKLKSFYNYEFEKASPKEGDVVVDCGAYIGDTAKMYLDRLNNNCKVYAIEACPNNYDILDAWVKKNELSEKVFPLMVGVGSEDGDKFITFEKTDFDPRAVLNDKKTTNSFRVEITTLDKLFVEKNIAVNFIKMDIEGAEKDALLGGKNIIEKYKPGMAIAAYHKPSHLWELPLLIKQINPGYKIYAGHHPKCIFELEYYIVDENV